ncbi:hypothetical protein ACVZHT_23955, partial [Vibrio diabolicus]
ISTSEKFGVVSIKVLFITVMANLPIGIGNDHRQGTQSQSCILKVTQQLRCTEKTNADALSIQNV